MPTRNEFRQSAKMRITEAKILFRNHSHPKTKLKGGLPREFKTHDISSLIVLSGLIKKLDNHKVTDPDFLANWSHIEQLNWTEQCRYDCHNPIKYNQPDIKAFIDAIDNRKGGFLKWISKYW